MDARIPVGRTVLLQVGPEDAQLLTPVLQAWGAVVVACEDPLRPGTLVIRDWTHTLGVVPQSASLEVGAELLLVVPDREPSTAIAAYETGAIDLLPRPLLLPEVRARLRLHLREGRAGLAHLPWRYVDPVTGLVGGSTLMARLEEEWARGARKGEPLALLAVEVDGGWAETLPEDLWQARLAALGTVLRHGAGRVEDVVAREQDGTFLMLLPESDIPAAHAVALSVLQQVRTLPEVIGGFTVSIGFAAAFPAQFHDPGPLLEATRRALRQAQARGGDRWSAADEG